MIDPFTSLAFNLYSLRGRYALLLGSGISSSAGIPTGWQIVLDLIRKVASAQGVDDCGTNPSDWYLSTFHEPPNYSKLIKMIGRTPSERREILKKYIEPTAEEREQHKKVPTIAHHGIAELVKINIIRVVMTTNFDRLIETALNGQEVSFNVVSTTDDIRGLEPLCHQSNLLVKVNGDYLDTRIKNTDEELLRFDRHLNKFLDSILTDFGLIVCGWSGKYDIALADSIKRNINRKYGIYWIYRGNLEPEAEEIIQRSDAEKIHINDADQFFKELKEKIFAIEKIDVQHPISSQVAVTRLKKYISEKNNIEIYDLFKNEWNNVQKKIFADEISAETWTNEQQYNEYLSKSISRIEILQKLLVNLLKWSDGSNSDIINPILKVLLNIDVEDERRTNILYLKLYPAITILYTIGIMLFYKNDYSSLNTILRDTSLENLYIKLFQTLRYLNAAESQNPNQITNPSPPKINFWNFMSGEKEYPLDYMKYIFLSSRESLKDYIFNEDEFENLFIRLDFFLRLFILNSNPNNYQEGHLYTLRSDPASLSRQRLLLPKIFQEIENNINGYGDNFEWIRSGLFNNRENLINNFQLYKETFRSRYEMILMRSDNYE